MSAAYALRAAAPLAAATLSAAAAAAAAAKYSSSTDNSSNKSNEEELGEGENKADSKTLDLSGAPDALADAAAAVTPALQRDARLVFPGGSGGGGHGGGEGGDDATGGPGYGLLPQFRPSSPERKR